MLSTYLRPQQQQYRRHKRCVNQVWHTKAPTVNDPPSKPTSKHHPSIHPLNSPPPPIRASIRSLSLPVFTWTCCQSTSRVINTSTTATSAERIKSRPMHGIGKIIHTVLDSSNARRRKAEMHATRRLKCTVHDSYNARHTKAKMHGTGQVKCTVHAS